MDEKAAHLHGAKLQLCAGFTYSIAIYELQERRQPKLDWYYRLSQL